MSIIKQQSTTDYSKFQHNPMNRLVADGDGYKTRKDLVDSMREHGYRKECPITCYKNADGTLTVIEGHNRLAAAMYLGLPVEYIVYERNGKGEWTPAQHSKGIKQWTIDQFISAYASTGIDDYIEVLDYAKKHQVTPYTAAGLFSGEQVSSGNIGIKIKSGTFKIKDRKTPFTIAKIIEPLQIAMKCALPKVAVAAVARCMYAPEFDPQRMISKIEKYPELCEKQKDLERYMDMLETIYNRNINSKDKYPLKFEADKAVNARNFAAR